MKARRHGGGYTCYGAARSWPLSHRQQPSGYTSPAPRCLAAARHVHGGGVGPHHSEQLPQLALLTLHLRLHTHMHAHACTCMHMHAHALCKRRSAHAVHMQCASLVKVQSW